MASWGYPSAREQSVQVPGQSVPAAAPWNAQPRDFLQASTQNSFYPPAPGAEARYFDRSRDVQQQVYNAMQPGLSTSVSQAGSLPTSQYGYPTQYDRFSSTMGYGTADASSSHTPSNTGGGYSSGDSLSGHAPFGTAGGYSSRDSLSGHAPFDTAGVYNTRDSLSGHAPFGTAGVYDTRDGLSEHAPFSTAGGYSSGVAMSGHTPSGTTGGFSYETRNMPANRFSSGVGEERLRLSASAQAGGGSRYTQPEGGSSFLTPHQHSGGSYQRTPAGATSMKPQLELRGALQQSYSGGSQLEPYQRSLGSVQQPTARVSLAGTHRSGGAWMSGGASSVERPNRSGRMFETGARSSGQQSYTSLPGARTPSSGGSSRQVDSPRSGQFQKRYESTASNFSSDRQKNVSALSSQKRQDSASVGRRGDGGLSQRTPLKGVADLFANVKSLFKPHPGTSVTRSNQSADRATTTWSRTAAHVTTATTTQSRFSDPQSTWSHSEGFKSLRSTTASFNTRDSQTGPSRTGAQSRSWNETEKQGRKRAHWDQKPPPTSVETKKQKRDAESFTFNLDSNTPLSRSSTDTRVSSAPKATPPTASSSSKLPRPPQTSTPSAPPPKPPATTPTPAKPPAADGDLQETLIRCKVCDTLVPNQFHFEAHLKSSAHLAKMRAWQESGAPAEMLTSRGIPADAPLPIQPSSKLPLQSKPPEKSPPKQAQVKRYPTVAANTTFCKWCKLRVGVAAHWPAHLASPYHTAAEEHPDGGVAHLGTLVRFFCTVCQTGTFDEAGFADHLAGKKHAKCHAHSISMDVLAKHASSTKPVVTPQKSATSAPDKKTTGGVGGKSASQPAVSSVPDRKTKTNGVGVGKKVVQLPQAAHPTGNNQALSKSTVASKSSPSAKSAAVPPFLKFSGSLFSQAGIKATPTGKATLTSKTTPTGKATPTGKTTLTTSPAFSLGASTKVATPTSMPLTPETRESLLEKAALLLSQLSTEQPATHVPIGRYGTALGSTKEAAAVKRTPSGGKSKSAADTQGKGKTGVVPSPRSQFDLPQSRATLVSPWSLVKLPQGRTSASPGAQPRPSVAPGGSKVAKTVSAPSPSPAPPPGTSVDVDASGGSMMEIEEVGGAKKVMRLIRVKRHWKGSSPGQDEPTVAKAMPDDAAATKRKTSPGATVSKATPTSPVAHPAKPAPKTPKAVPDSTVPSGVSASRASPIVPAKRIVTIQTSGADKPQGRDTSPTNQQISPSEALPVRVSSPDSTAFARSSAERSRSGSAMGGEIEDELDISIHPEFDGYELEETERSDQQEGGVVSRRLVVEEGVGQVRDGGGEKAEVKAGSLVPAAKRKKMAAGRGGRFAGRSGSHDLPRPPPPGAKTAIWRRTSYAGNFPTRMPRHSRPLTPPLRRVPLPWVAPPPRPLSPPPRPLRDLLFRSGVPPPPPPLLRDRLLSIRDRLGPRPRSRTLPDYPADRFHDDPHFEPHPFGLDDLVFHRRALADRRGQPPLEPGRLSPPPLHLEPRPFQLEPRPFLFSRDYP